MKYRLNVLRSTLGITGLIVGLVASSGAAATVLLSEDFTGAVISDGLTIDLIDNPGNTANDNLNQWIDFPNSYRWGIQSGGICDGVCSGDFAQHLVQTSDNTNLLYYGLSGASVSVGADLTLDFDFISSNRAGTAYLVGMMFGQHSLDPHAGWFPPDDTNDGVVLASLSLDSDSWTSASFTHTLTLAYDVYVVAFKMRGTDGMRGIDNVVLQATSVPEPGTLVLLGLGLAGFGFVRRRKA